MRLLMIEDSPQLQRSLAEGLRRNGYVVEVVGSGSDGLLAATQSSFDVVILDILLPGMDGLAVLRELRLRRNNVPVLLLTARDTVDDRVAGLRTGADDYLTKPFAFDELLARIESLIRRANGQADPIIRVGNIEIHTAQKRATMAGERVNLTAREYSLLQYLALNRGRVLSRTQIEQHIYDSQVEPMSNVVDSVIYVLRKKFDRPGQRSMIETRRGQGYVFMDEP